VRLVRSGFEGWVVSGCVRGFLDCRSWSAACGSSTPANSRLGGESSVHLMRANPCRKSVVGGEAEHGWRLSSLVSARHGWLTSGRRLESVEGLLWRGRREAGSGWSSAVQTPLASDMRRLSPTHLDAGRLTTPTWVSPSRRTRSAWWVWWRLAGAASTVLPPKARDAGHGYLALSYCPEVVRGNAMALGRQ